jgi:hypothetical protein
LSKFGYKQDIKVLECKHPGLEDQICILPVFLQFDQPFGNLFLLS